MNLIVNKTLTALAGIAALLCCLSFDASAQRTREYEAYASSAREQSMLFRGRQGISYAGIAYNGTFYWNSPEFLEGEIMYNGKLYSGVSLNIDAAAHHILVRYAPGMPSVIVPKDYVPYFTIGGTRYVNVALLGLFEEPEEECIMEELSGGPIPVYRRVRKILSSSSADVNGRMIGYYDPHYHEEYTSYFRFYEQYFTVSEGCLKRISRRRALKMTAYGK